MLVLNSPAKVNLFLRVLGRRPDGYHELASLFQTIDLQDTLHLSLDQTDALTCSDPSLSTGQDNLVLKAASLFRQKTGKQFGLKAHLEKRIPTQAGLGGGSGNAATTLWGLNQLLGLPATLLQLQQWSSEIGSDIPFFFSTGTAYCTGRGEQVRIEKVSALPSFSIVKPAMGASTTGVYGKLQLDCLTNRDPLNSLSSFCTDKPEYYNDLERAAFDLLPELEVIKKTLLSRGFETVMLCGSGSSFFCVGEADPRLAGCMTYSVNPCQRDVKSWY